MHTIDQLLKSRLIHRGRDLAPPGTLQPSGFTPLDQLLGGGLPRVGVCRIRSTPGIGELRLLLPCLLSETAKLSVFISPPGSTYPDFWQAREVAAEQLLSIETQSVPQKLWAARECLQSGCCNAVILWQEAIRLSDVKRLQLAAAKGQSCLWIMQAQPTTLSLPLTLSLRLQARAKGLEVSITKRKGGWPAGPVCIGWQQLWPDLALSSAIPNNSRPLQPHHLQSI